MANFFSDAPIDLGARYKYQGYADMGQGIASGLKMGANALWDQKMQKQQNEHSKAQLGMQESLLQKRRQMEIEQQISFDAADVGITPIMNQDGSMNAIATSARVNEAKRIRKSIEERAKAQLGREDAYQFALQNEAKKYPGVGGHQGGPASMGSFTGKSQAQPFDANLPLEAQIEAAQRRQKLSEVTAEASARAQGYNSVDTASIKTARYRAQLLKNLKDITAKKQGFLERGEEVPFELADQFSTAMAEHNALGRQGEAIDPTFQDTIQEFSRRRMPAGSIEKLTTGLSTVSQAVRALDSMERAVEILGGGAKGEAALTQYAGLGVVQARELVSKFALPDEQKAAVLDAIQGTEQVRGAVRYSLYAGNLTESESGKFNLQAGDPINKDYFDRTRTFLRNTFDKENDRLMAMQKEYYVPKSFVEEFNKARGIIYSKPGKTQRASTPKPPQAAGGDASVESLLSKYLNP